MHYNIYLAELPSDISVISIATVGMLNCSPRYLCKGMLSRVSDNNNAPDFDPKSGLINRVGFKNGQSFWKSLTGDLKMKSRVGTIARIS